MNTIMAIFTISNLIFLIILTKIMIIIIILFMVLIIMIIIIIMTALQVFKEQVEAAQEFQPTLVNSHRLLSSI